MSLKNKLILSCAVALGVLLTAGTCLPRFALNHDNSITDEQEYVFAENDMLMSGSFSDTGMYVSGNYRISLQTGEVYYYPDGQTMFAGGTADDGNLYDENGAMQNLPCYIYQKYKTAYENAGTDEFVEFEDIADMELFLTYIQLEEGNRQGQTFRFEYRSGGRTACKKGVILSTMGKPDESYWDIIDSLASQIDMSASDYEKTEQAAKLVTEYMDYDNDYYGTGITQATADGKGVCYHMSKMLKNILDELGVYCEYMTGKYVPSNTNHTWLRVWDGQNKRWVYKDPVRDLRTKGIFSVTDTYYLYVSEYRISNYSDRYFRTRDY